MADHQLRIKPGNQRRLLETRADRRVRFNEKRREAFLSHLAATCNVLASAEVAGVSPCTTYRIRRLEPAFRALWDEALDQGYARLEARLLQLSEIALGDDRGIEADPRAADMDVPRIMALLRQRPSFEAGRGRGGQAARRAPQPAPIEDVAKQLIKRLKAMGVTLPPPPAVAALPPPGQEAAR